MAEGGRTLLQVAQTSFAASSETLCDVEQHKDFETKGTEHKAHEAAVVPPAVYRDEHEDGLCASEVTATASDPLLEKRQACSDGSHRSQDMSGSSPRRRFIVALATVFATLALGILLSHAVGAADLFQQSPPMALNETMLARLKSERMSAKFWTVRPASMPESWSSSSIQEQTFEIVPALADFHAVAEGLLDHASFKARLVRPYTADQQRPQNLPSGSMQVIKILEAPMSTSASTYRFSVPSSMRATPAGSYTLEVRLEYGFYPGIDGQPCPERTCLATSPSLNETEVYQSNELIGPAMTITVEDSSIDDPLLEENNDNFESFTGECHQSDFTAMRGAWVDEQFRSEVEGCDLPAQGDLRRLAATMLPENSTTWIHMLGDSVTRYTMVNLITQELRLVHMYSYSAPKEKYDNSYLGIEKFEGNRTLVITYRWWYRQSPVVPKNPAVFSLDQILDPENISAVFDWDILKTLKPEDSAPPSGFQEGERFLPPGKPDYIFLALGSHSPSMTALGVDEHLWSIRPLLKAVKDDGDRLCLLTTTSVRPGLHHEPLGHQIRNEAMIRARNAVLSRHADELRVPLLDWHRLVGGTEFNWYADFIHPGDIVRSAQSRSLFGQFLRHRILGIY